RAAQERPRLSENATWPPPHTPHNATHSRSRWLGSQRRLLTTQPGKGSGAPALPQEAPPSCEMYSCPVVVPASTRSGSSGAEVMLRISPPQIGRTRQEGGGTGAASAGASAGCIGGAGDISGSPPGGSPCGELAPPGRPSISQASARARITQPPWGRRAVL